MKVRVITTDTKDTFSIEKKSWFGWHCEGYITPAHVSFLTSIEYGEVKTMLNEPTLSKEAIDLLKNAVIALLKKKETFQVKSY